MTTETQNLRNKASALVEILDSEDHRDADAALADLRSALVGGSHITIEITTSDDALQDNPAEIRGILAQAADAIEAGRDRDLIDSNGNTVGSVSAENWQTWADLT